MCISVHILYKYTWRSNHLLYLRFLFLLCGESFRGVGFIYLHSTSAPNIQLLSTTFTICQLPRLVLSTITATVLFFNFTFNTLLFGREISLDARTKIFVSRYPGRKLFGQLSTIHQVVLRPRRTYTSIPMTMRDKH